MSHLKEFAAQCRSYLDSGHYEDVILLCTERLRNIPGDPESELFIAEARLSKGDITDAKIALESLCLRLQSLSKTYKLLGDLCYRDNPEIAKDYYRRYLALDPETEDSTIIQEKLESETTGSDGGGLNTGFKTITMVDLMIKQGHIDTAREILKEILSHDPDNTQAEARFEKIRVIQELEKWRKVLPRKSST